LTGHNGPVQDVTLSANGQFAISASWDKTVRIWEVANGTCANTITGHNSDVLSVAFSPDQRSIVSVGRDRSVVQWNTRGEACNKVDNGHSDWISAVRFSPNPKNPVFFTASWDKTVKMWEANESSIVEKACFSDNGHKGPVNTIAVSPDGSLCASGGKDGQVCLWGVQAGNKVNDYSVNVGVPINVLCFCPQKYWICVATDVDIQIWDLQASERKCTVTRQEVEEGKVELGLSTVPTTEEDKKNKKKFKAEPHLPWITACSWSASGDKLFAGTSTNEVLVFDVNYN